MATSTKDKRVELVLEHFNRSKNWRSQFESRWSDYYKMYRSHRADKEKGRANLFIPKPYELVETGTALLMGVAFPKRPFANFSPRPGTQGTDEEAKQATNFIDYQLNEHMKIVTTMNLYIKNMVAYGTAFAKIGWRREVGKIKTREVVEEIQMVPGLFGIPMPQRVPVMKEVEQVVNLVDSPYFERISIWDAYPHPDEIAGLKRKLPFIHRKVLTLDELAAFNKNDQEPVYINLDEVKKMGTWDSGKESVVSPPRQDMGVSEGIVERVELLECILEQGRRIITIANRQILVRDQENPFYHGQMPVVSTPYSTDLDGSVYGISILDPGMSLFFELNDNRNQIMDNVNLALKAPFVADRDRLDDPDNVIFAPDNMIEVQGRPNDVIMKLEVPDFTGRAKDMEMIIKGDIQSYSGVTQIAQGTGTEGLSNDTASGMSMLLEQLNKRLGPTYDVYQETCMIPALHQIRHLNHQFLDSGHYPMQGGGSGEVTYEHFKPEYDIMCTGSVAYTSKAVRFQQAMGLFDKLGQHPNVKPVPLIREILEMGDYDNIDEILELEPPDPPKDVQYVITLKSDLTPNSEAQVLEQIGIKMDEQDLLGKNIDWANQLQAENFSVQSRIDQRMMGQGGPEQNVAQRMPHDELAKGAKQNANTSGT